MQELLDSISTTGIFIISFADFTIGMVGAETVVRHAYALFASDFGPSLQIR